MSRKNGVIQKHINNTESHPIFLNILGGWFWNWQANKQTPGTGLFGVSISKVPPCRTVGLASAKIWLQNQGGSLGAFRCMFKTFQILLEQEIHAYTAPPPTPPPPSHPHTAPAALFPTTKRNNKELHAASFSYLRFGGHWNGINTRYEATVLRPKKL